MTAHQAILSQICNWYHNICQILGTTLGKSTCMNLNLAIFYSTCTNLLRIKDLRKVSTYPLVCLRFSQTLLHQNLGTFLRKKSLNLGWRLLSGEVTGKVVSSTLKQVRALRIIRIIAQGKIWRFGTKTWNRYLILELYRSPVKTLQKQFELVKGANIRIYNLL